MYLIHFIGSKLSGEEAEGSEFMLQGTENTSSEDFVTLLGQPAIQLE